jgi:hypothetical protein
MVGGRTAAVAIVLVASGAASCASNAPNPRSDGAPIIGSSFAAQQDPVPLSLRTACGHPGAQATLAAVPITIARDQCDLTGVVVRYGQTGVTVPTHGGVQAIADGISGA